MEPQYKPQRSKRKVAIRLLHDYFFDLIHNEPWRGDDPDKIAHQMAEEAYKIVKKAEGFDV